MSSQKVETKCLDILRKMLEEARNDKQNAVGYSAYEHFYHKEKALEELIEEVLLLEN